MLKVYVDGGVKNNTIYIGVFSNSSKLNIKVNKKMGIGSTHTAEELALYSSLKILQELKINDIVTIYSDHKSIVSLINKKTIANNSFINFPKLDEMKSILSLNPNIKVSWIKKSNNLAHSLVVDAYIGRFINKFYYNIPSKNMITFEPINADNANINKIKLLELEISKKDLIIDSLLNVIAKINKSNQLL